MFVSIFRISRCRFGLCFLSVLSRFPGVRDDFESGGG